MKIDLKKIINIKHKSDFKSYELNKPIFQSNYLFHYLIQLRNLNGLKLHKFPIYIENNDNLNGFLLAAKEYDFDILCYLIDTYPEYIYNKNSERESFVNYLPMDELPKFIKKYPKLDWIDLIDYNLLKTIMANLNFKDLNNIIDIINIKSINDILLSIIINDNINDDDKIKLLDKYSDDDINMKDDKGNGLILLAINKDNKKIFNYLINRNIDLDYYSMIKTNNPLRYSLSFDILNNKYYYSKIILNHIKKNNKDFYKELNKDSDNIAHSLFYIRINKNNQLNLVENDINYEPDFDILPLLDNNTWNQYNKDKQTPLELITNFDYKIYSKLFNDNKIKIRKETLNKIKENDKINNNFINWLKLFNTFDEYIENNDNIDLIKSDYVDCTIFRATFQDLGTLVIYLSDNYEQLLIPNLKSYLLNNLTFDNTFPMSDNIINKEQIFPWYISYHSTDEYYIHPYLNNIINSERRNNKKRFGCVFINIINDDIFHANILIYDFKNMTIERFEPYGNTSNIDNDLDDLLEEELTWNTGLKYMRPSDILPWAGFQTLSQELKPENIKPGDYGGFCLVWCLWYLESRLTNPEIKPKILIEKLIKKMSNMDIKFSEYIRNYSNKINKQRIKYFKFIGIDSKMSSNTYFDNNSQLLLTNFLIKKFNKI